MVNYPIIKTPEFLSSPNLYYDLLGDLIKPKEPEMPEYNKESSTLIILYGIIGMPLLMIGLQVVGIIISVTILIILISNKKSREEKKWMKEQNTYEENYKKYLSDLTIYRYDLDEKKWRDKQTIRMQNSPRLKNRIIKTERISFLKDSRPPSKNEFEVKKGIMETAFSIILNRNFDGMILQNRAVNNYFPDFIYFNNKYNFYIDIEIDEPYDGKTKEPIHFIGSDEERDNFFIINRWSVIRFSEKQVVEYPQECCNEIKKLVNSIFKNTHKYSNNKDRVPKEPAWTKTKALKMAEENYRDSYLSIQKNHLINNLLKMAK